MPNISEYYEFENAPVEFLDVDVADDNRLFLDPHALRIERGPSPFAREAKERLDSFFDEIVTCVLSPRTEDQDRGLDLLQHFEEPKETRLGLSRSGIDGHGGAGEVGKWIWHALATDARALIDVGVFKLVEHIPLFVDGVDRDITSDITTRIVFEPLARFTQAMVRKYPEFSQNGHRLSTYVRPVWNIRAAKWAEKSLELPEAEDKALLLVPRYWAQHRLLMSHGRYYDTALLSWVQEQLAVVDKRTGRLRKDPKWSLKRKRKYKRGRGTILRVTGEANKADEDLVDRFRAFVDHKYKRLDDDEIDRRLEE
jgi:hypothetical protein